MRLKWWYIFPAIVVLLGILAWWMWPRYQESRIDPNELLDQSLKNTAAALSFKYNLNSSLVVEGRREVISRVEGEKSKDGNIHIKGEMVKTPVDIYHIDGTIYNKDAFSKKWLVIKDVQSNSTKVLISELDPLSNFNFKSIGEIQRTGWERVDGNRCALVCCKPSVENELMEILWQDFTYKIWIDSDEKVVRKATLSAVSKNSPKTYLQMQVTFKDFNKRITVEKPKID
ncbi:MAG: hypothetical protein ACM3MK_03195 [Chitinophagales bacterium]